MDTLTLTALATLVWKAGDLVKNAFATHWDSVLTQLMLWAAGIALAFIAGAATVAGGIAVWGSTIGRLDGWSKVLLGLSLSSFGGATYDIKKAIDSSQTSWQPTLLGGRNQRAPRSSSTPTRSA